MTNKTFGYARVSTVDQNPASQEDALRHSGADEIFVDFFTGTKSSRPGLDQVLVQLRSGDSLMITRLDRLGRSTKDLLELVTKLDHLGANLIVLEQQINTATPEGRLFFTMIAAFAQFEREIMRARTMDGLAAARARGRSGGRKPSLSESQAQLVQRLVSEGIPISKIAKDFSVSRPTVYRAIG